MEKILNIILSARERKTDIVKGYNLGADVYLTKPVEPEILIAAIERLGTRANARYTNEVLVAIGANRIVFGTSTQPLSSSEAPLLHRLTVAGSRGLERHEMAESLGFDLDSYNPKALELRLLRLRKKIKAVGLQASQIETMRGFDYRLNNGVNFTFV